MSKKGTRSRFGFSEKGSLVLDTGGRMKLRLASAAGPWKRLLGLMGMDELDPSEALLLERCNSIHMCFMRFPIDVIWLARPAADGSRRVVGVSRNVRPWRLAIGPRGTDSCIEMSAGCAPAWPRALERATV